MSSLAGVYLKCFSSHKSTGANVGIALGIIAFFLAFQFCIGALVCVIISNLDGPDLPS